jgi:hypothetical protein
VIDEHNISERERELQRSSIHEPSNKVQGQGATWCREKVSCQIVTLASGSEAKMQATEIYRVTPFIFAFEWGRSLGNGSAVGLMLNGPYTPSLQTPLKNQ